MGLKTKIGAAIATSVLLATTFVPVAFAADITITDNGFGSTNNAAEVKVKKSKVKQKNRTIAATHTNTASDTGGNTANKNTGGSETVTTGTASTPTTVTVAGGTNDNSAVNCCCGEENGNTITITDNGAFSKNNALIVDVCKNKVKQSNTTVVWTNITANSNTGNNSADQNTGSSVLVDTGNATTTTNVNVTGSSNTNTTP